MLRIRLILAAVLLCCPAICRAGPAEDILRTTGVQGGLIVHLGCGDGTLTADLRVNNGYLVHGLDRDAAKVAAARALLKRRGVYGPVSVDQLRGDQLPYTDDLVNLVVCEDADLVSADEIMRVLRPRGVAYIKHGASWQKSVKPWPREIDEWTHFLHGPDNNAVAHDVAVDVPRRLRWLGQPKFARAHEQLASMGACVTTNGRMFYVIDEAARADIRFPAKWFLVARDAFNGVVLWKRPIPTWVDQLRRFRSGPAETAFRLAAKDDIVYVTLGIDAPVSFLDAATGNTLATCKDTDHARQILRLGDRIVVLADTEPQHNEQQDSQIRRGLQPAPGTRRIVVADARTGTEQWRKETEAFIHPTLAAQGERLFYQTRQEVVCMNIQSGKELWRTPMKLQLAGHELGWESPTLVVHGKAVYCADFKQLVARSVDDGHVLWQAPCQPGYNSPPDVFVIGDLVWLKGRTMKGLDVATGEVRREINTIPGYMHHRCYRNKATDRFFLLGNQGVQFVGLDSYDVWPNHWIRGTCQYGIMPANGLLYVAPDSCACNMKTKLSGFWTLAPESDRPARPDARDARWERGAAFGQVAQSGNDESLRSWPVYRHDFTRSGMTSAHVPANLRRTWRVPLGGRLSGLTAGDGKVFVASVDTHTVLALDERSGKQIWSFTAGGRVDSPPTVYHGMILFGSADGCVYALRATDGELVWRFRAAPIDQRTFVNGQLESIWPVHGSVLVHRGQLIVTAGRSSYLDGGIHVCRLEPETGRLIAENVIYSPDPETGKQPADPNTKDVHGVLSDILVADGDDLYMRHMKLDLETGDQTQTGVHLFSPIGLLDDSWWHRAYWVVSDQFISHWSGWWRIGNVVPSGRILSYDKESVYGYGRDKYPSGNTGQWRGGEQYRLFACDRPSPDQMSKRAAPQPGTARRKGKKRGKKQPETPPLPDRWRLELPLNVRAMAVTGDTVFVAGPPADAQTEGSGEARLKLVNPAQAVAAWGGQEGGQLWAVSRAEGKKLAAQRLDVPPVFDGMAVTEGRLYLALTDGSVVCFAGSE